MAITGGAASAGCLIHRSSILLNRFIDLAYELPNHGAASGGFGNDSGANVMTTVLRDF